MEEETLIDLESSALTLEDLKSQLASEMPNQQRVLLPSAEGFLGIPQGYAPEDLQRATSVGTYAAALTKAMEPQDPLAKALGTPPNAFSFVTMAYMPDPQSGGLQAWPGIAPNSLQKLARTNLAPEMIIATRICDVLRYSTRSSHPWKPGWRVELKDHTATPTNWDRRDIRACEQMLENCSLDGSADTPRKRDKAGFPDLKRFMAELVRDYLTYDSIAIWTDLDARGRVKGWVPLPAGNIRLSDPKIGYLGNPDHFAVLIDEVGTVVQPFTRDELIWHVGNPKLDPDWGGYGWSRLDAGMRLIDGFQAAFDMNADTFSKNSFPTGMMLLKGAGWTQNELDAIARQISNLKKGVSKIWSMPAMVVPKDSEVEFLDLNAAKDKDTLYQNYMNLIMSVFCMLYQFPYRRMGFRVSDSGQDNEPLDQKGPASMSAPDEDEGLIQLLSTIEHILNKYIIETRFPHLQVVFCGKAPREDAREYEARQLALTYGERRAQADLPSLEDIAKGPEQKKLAKLMSMAPIDPGMAGIYQAVASAIIGASADKEAGGPAAAARFPASKDPAKSESKGATSGVRRHSPSARAKKSSLMVPDEDEDIDFQQGWPSRGLPSGA